MLSRYTLSNGKMEPSDNQSASVYLFISPDESEKKYLAENIKIDEHNLQSSLDPDEVSRIEFEPDHVAIIIKRPKNYSTEDKFLFKVSSMGIFAFQDKLVIIMTEDVSIFKEKQFSKVQSLQEVLLRLIFTAITHFFGHLKVINMISDSLEQKISTSMENKYLTSMFALEKSLVYYLNAINYNTTVFDKVKANAQKIGLSESDREYLDDIMIENNQCYRQAEIYANILASLMDARASIVNNNLSILMKTLNFITISIMVPTFIVSAFSMNVDIPFRRHPLAFWIILGVGLIALSVFIISYNFFWRVKRGK